MKSVRPVSTKNTSILLLGSQMETGGAQRILLDQAQYFHEHAYTVTVAFLYDKENLHGIWQERYDYPIINLEARQHTRQGFHPFKRCIWLLRSILRLYRLMKREQIDIIETFHHHCNLIGIPIAWLSGVPTRIASNHGYLRGFPQWLRVFHKFVIRSRMTTKYVVVSQALLEDSHSQHIPDQKVVVIPNGIQQLIPEDAAVEALRQSLGLSPGQPILLTAGRLTEVKGHGILLQALPIVTARFPDAVLLIAGDGPLREHLEQEAEQLKIKQHVRFLGIRDDLPALMHLARLFILPSLWEGLPLVVLEAMSAGLPVIASEVGGLPQLIEQNESGILVPSNDPVRLSASITSLLSDEKRCEQLAERACQIIEQNYTQERMCQRYEALWQARHH